MTPQERVWHERLSRVLDVRDEHGTPYRLTKPELRELFFRLVSIEGNAEQFMDVSLEPGDGVRRSRVTLEPNPFHGERADVERGVAWVWDEIGKFVGVGPRPSPAKPAAARWRDVEPSD
jgi:hypothetical protein